MSSTAKRPSAVRHTSSVMTAAVEPPKRVESEASQYLVTIEEGAEVEALSVFESVGLQEVVNTAEMSADQLASDGVPEKGKGVVLSRLGIAALTLDPDQAAALAKESGSSLKAVELAPTFFAFEPISEAYLRGYRDCADALLRNFQPGLAFPSSPESDEVRVAAGQASTWGLQTTGVLNSSYNGTGIRVAVLDTGLDLTHPDFAGRRIVSQSFIPGEPVQDKHSHGTHCIGTACGPRSPRGGIRYGIAWAADIYAGKVLSNTGGSRGRSVELGMEWALANRCHVISMSLGSPVLPGMAPIVAYERIGSRALAAGTLIVAAAGNDSVRSRGIINAVGSPANCPSIFGVGAVDSGMSVADFSNGGINPQGGEVNLAAPGVDVYSSVPGGYGKKNGTSMATPHVAGIAALWSQATGKTGKALWDALTTSVRPLPLDVRDVGSGFVQAPA